MRKTADKIKNYLRIYPQALLNDEAYQLASLKHAPDMADVIWEVKRAFQKGIAPERSLHSSSGTFFLKDCDGEPIAVFKKDQSLHEFAAYRLDHNHFAGVPQTVITTLEHPAFEGKQTGACQSYVKDSITAVEIDRRLFEHFSSASVRRIATLDIRVMNEDRHSSNILVINQKEMVPIDHGYTFPRDLSSIQFTWADWLQAMTHFNEVELSYISLIEPERDRHLLMEEIHFEEIFANRLFVATVLLKLGAIRGLCAANLGNLMARKRPGHKELSCFEHLVEKIKQRNPSNWQAFSRYVYGEVDKLLDESLKVIVR